MRLPIPSWSAAALAVVWMLAPGFAARGGAQERDADARGRSRGDKSKGEEEQIRKRMEWFVLSRGLDRVRRPDALRAEAVRGLQQAQLARAPALTRAGETWQSLGPVTMTMLNWSMGRVTGQVPAFAAHPGDENVLYLGGNSGGVWKTTNGGGLWTPVFDAAGTLAIGSLAVDRGDGNVVWVGTGERGAACAGYFGLGVFRSTDGGASFEARNGSGSAALQLSNVVSIALHPTRRGTLLVSGDGFCQEDGTKGPGGVFKSTDAGASWRRVLAGAGSDVLYEPGNPSVVYAAISKSGIHKSTDGGETWVRAGTGMVTGNGIGRLQLAISPSNPQVLYALSSSSRLYRSGDGAASWSQRNARACEGQCTYNLTIDVHPTEPDTVLVGTIRVTRSTDGGTTLRPLISGWGRSQKVHQDIHVIRYSRADGNRFWVGSDGGLWRTDDGGASYVNLNANLNLTQFYDVAVDPDDPTRVFGGAQDNSSSRRLGGQQWNVTDVTGDGFMNLVDPADTQRVFQTSYPGDGPSIMRSTSGGAPGTFNWLDNGGIDGEEPFPWVTPLAIVGGTIFVGSHSVYRAASAQSESGFRWTKISGNLTGSDTKAISVITVQPAGSGAAAYVGTSTGRIHRTGNALAGSVSWSDVTGDFPGGYVSDVAVDPADLQRVWVTRGAFGGGHLYRSASGGTSWAEVGRGLPNVPANAVAVDPLDRSRVFVGTDVGVFESADGGDSFVPFSLGLPAGLVVTDLEVDDAPHVLVAGTYGRGAYRVNLAGTSNRPPAAAFSFSVDGLTVRFQDQSSDPDGTVASRLWSFGDGTSSTAASPAKTYAAAGSRSVSLTATDDQGASSTATRSVPVGGGCGGQTLAGSLSGPGGEQVQPDGSWYQSAAAGQHVGCLAGPSGADYDLYLDQWSGGAWAEVAKSDGPTNIESVTFSGAPGFYRWRIRSSSGSGGYTFRLSKP